ncbi:MAG: PD-(D/E)XK nuclease family protein [Steroidobacteraceae bacterium]
MDAQLYALLTDGATLLTASRHLAHALRQEYAYTAQAHGLLVWPTPRILPWSTYLRTACQQQRNHQDHKPPPRLLSELQSLALWERIVAESDSGQTLLNPAQAARNAQRSWQRLHQYRIPLRKAAAYPGEEAQVFCEWAQQFSAHTAQHHWLDSARFAGYLHDTQFQPDTALVVYGFDQLTPEMQYLLQAWRDRGAVIHILEPASRQARAQVIAAKDGHDELKLAARWARQQVESGKTRVAVVVPNLTAQAAQVQRRFTEVFAPAQRRIDQTAVACAFRVVATPGLSSYPLVHHALLLLQLMQGRADVLLIGQLLRSPFMAGYEAEAAARAMADVQARDSRREYWNCNELERLAAISHCLQLAGSMQATANYLREHQGSALPSQWTERFTQLLKLSGWSRGRSLDSNEQQTLIKFQQVLAELSALDELLGRINLTRAIAALRDACHAENFAPESLDQAVTLIDADSIAGMQFDALWVMGLHAGDWPPAPEPDPFLPIELQREYGLPEASAESCLSLARGKLQRLVRTADAVILSWPQHDEDAELRPSPLLSAYPALTLEDLPQAGTPALATQLFTQRPDLDVFTDNYAPPQAPGEARGGSRIVELQSRCPFRAQAELRLHAEAMPSVSPAVEATERGTLVHRVLKELWQQLKDSANLQAAEMTALVHTVRGIAERVAQQVIPASTLHRQRLVALEVELCVQWVMALLRVEAQRLPFRVHRAEQNESYELSGMHITIQLDRIDELSDGGMLLIDYKTGDSNHANDWLDRTPGRPRSPQLPLYALAHRQQLAGIAFAVLAPGRAEFRGLADTDSIAPGIADYAQQKPYKKLPGIDTWDDLLQHWETVLNTLAQQYLSGAAQVDPLKNECIYCHLSSLCRVHELLEAVDMDAEEEGSDV